MSEEKAKLMETASTPAKPVSPPQNRQESTPAAGDTVVTDTAAAEGDTSQATAASTPMEERENKTVPPAPPTPEVDDKAQKVDISEVKADTVNIAPDIHHIYNTERQDIVNYYLSPPGSQETIRSFSATDCVWISDAKEVEIAQLFMANDAEIEGMLRLLADKRLLVISGEPDTGKVTTAIYLGKQLAESSLSDIEQGTYLVPPLDRQIRLDLRALCTDAQICGKRLLIFEDALVRGNADIVGFFARLTRGSEDIARALRQNQAFLIFTARPAEIKTFQHALAENGLHHHLGVLSPTLLQEGFEKRLQFLAVRQQISAKQLELLRAERHLVLEAFKSMPRIARFIEYYGRELGSGTAMSPTEAIRRFHDITYWFLKDLPQDFEAWCFALALCLTQCGRETQATPWMECVQLWRLLTQWLRVAPDILPTASPAARPQQEPQRADPSLTDDHVFLEKCRAEIVKDPSSLADTVRFCDTSYPHEIWRVLLTSHRRLLTLLLPHFRRMVEHVTGGDAILLHTLAAQIIGRIGEIDPERITFETMECCVQAEDKRLRTQVGQLYCGVLSSQDERYRSLGLHRLNTLTAPPEGGQDDENRIAVRGDDIVTSRAVPRDSASKEKNRLLTAIATYVQVGRFDLPQAMRALGQIASRLLEPVMRDVQRIQRLQERIEREFNQPLDADEAVSLAITHHVLRDLAYRLYANEGGIFLGIQLALVSLCRTVDPVHVCQELRTWATASQTMGALVALMFLQEAGIASQLEITKDRVPGRNAVPDSKNTGTAGGQPPHRSSDVPRRSAPLVTDGGELHRLPPRDDVLRRNPIVLALTTGHEAVGQMARFLATMYESFSTQFALPSNLQRYCQLSFWQHLHIWVLDAMPIESGRMAMEDLFVELLHIRGGRLYEPLYQRLNGKAFTGTEGALKTFADAVLRRY